MITPAHRSRIWKRGGLWLARRPEADGKISRRNFATHGEAVAWATELHPRRKPLLGVAVGDVTQELSAAALAVRRSLAGLGAPRQADFTLAGG